MGDDDDIRAELFPRALARISSLEHTLSAVQADANKELERRREAEKRVEELTAECKVLAGYRRKDFDRREIDQSWADAVEKWRRIATERGVQLDRTQAECERMRAVYEAAVAWHRLPSRRNLDCPDLDRDSLVGLVGVAEGEPGAAVEAFTPFHTRVRLSEPSVDPTRVPRLGVLVFAPLHLPPRARSLTIRSSNWSCSSSLFR